MGEFWLSNWVPRLVVMYNGTLKQENQDIRRAWQTSSAVMECTGWSSIQFVLRSMKVTGYRNGELLMAGSGPTISM